MFKDTQKHTDMQKNSIVAVVTFATVKKLVGKLIKNALIGLLHGICARYTRSVIT